MEYIFVILFLVTILSLSIYYQFYNPNELFEENIVVDEEYVKSLEPVEENKETVEETVEETNMVNEEVEISNKFVDRQNEMDKLRDSLSSSHEMEEKSFDDILNNSPNQSTVFDNDIFDNAIYYENKEGVYSGIKKCRADCKGNCLEFGPTGHSWCFPIG